MTALHAAFILWLAGFALALALFAAMRVFVLRTEERAAMTPRETFGLVGFGLLASALWFVVVVYVTVEKVREWLMFRRYERWLDTPEGRRSGAERYGRP